MDLDPESFWRLRLVGGRFESAAIPLEFLKDLAVIGDLVVDVAKWRFLKDHPDRQRARRGFASGVRFTLARIDQGSTIPVISIETTSPSLFPDQDLRYFAEARDAISTAVGAAERGDSAVIMDSLPPSAFSYFDRFGRGLQDEEAVEFSVSGGTVPGRLTRETRRTLVRASKAEAITESITIRGRAPMVDRTKGRFALELLDGRRIEGVLESPHDEVIAAAVAEYKTGAMIEVEGIGRFDRSDRLLDFVALDRVQQLDPLDVRARLDQFKHLQDGWLGGHGVAPGKGGLEWLAATFEAWFADDLPLPYLYPTEAGGVMAEWDVEDLSPSLEIDLPARMGEWHVLDHRDGTVDEDTVDLRTEGGWRALAEHIRAAVGEAR